MALGGVLSGTSDVELGGVVSSSHGLADNRGRSYAGLFDLNEPDKGVFAGATLRWRHGQARASLGGWTSTASYPGLGESSSGRRGGLFVVLGGGRGRRSFSARLGASGAAVSERSGFVGATGSTTRG